MMFLNCTNIFILYNQCSIVYSMARQRTFSLVFGILLGIFLLWTMRFFSFNLFYSGGQILFLLVCVGYLYGGFSSEKISKEMNKWGGLALIVLPILSVFYSGYFSGSFTSLVFVPVGIVSVIVGFFVNIDEKRKIYNTKKQASDMKIQYIFYTVGVLFIFASVWYFAREFIDELPDTIKLFLLIVSVIITFIIAEFLRGADK